MPRKSKKPKSPNGVIDTAITALMGKLTDAPPDVAVKILNTAISWEKVKAKILDDVNDFDPDNL